MVSVRLGIDIGGTFTDITVLEEETGKMTVAKVPSRRNDPGGALISAVEKGLELAAVSAEEVTMLVHGTTIVTNAVLERKLPTTALITTEGFRDVLEIGRHFRKDMYDLMQDKPEIIIPRDRRFAVSERTSADGQILKFPEYEEAKRLFGFIRETGSEAIAICFLNSFVNPDNEACVRTWLNEAMPDIHVAASFEVCREIREFERMSTVSLNAAAMPLITKYLGEITPKIEAILPNAHILLMQSNGGSLTVSAAQDYPVRMITSGPAGGALAVQRLGQASQFPNLLGVDMGGTSTDISLIDQGKLRMTTEGGIDELPVKVPMIEINTIGAGAGSIAWLDDWNGLHVGPQSAGAEPGPAAYQRGGTEPTVTDANLVLGRMHPDRFVGGDMTVNLQAAHLAIENQIARPLKMTVEEAASGIIQIANANMERAVRISSAEKGYDPRDITLLAFGGAGPMHAAALAKAVGIPTVVIPERPGVFSAVGLVMSDIRHDFGQTRVFRGEEIKSKNLKPLFDSLDLESHAALERDGIAEQKRKFQRSADLRYLGQAYEVNVPVPSGELDDAAVDSILQSFHDLHQQLYAHHHKDKLVEFVSGRVAAIGLMSAPDLSVCRASSDVTNATECRQVYFDEANGFMETKVYKREFLAKDNQFVGPAIVEQSDSTTVIHPGQKARIDNLGNLIISIEGNS